MIYWKKATTIAEAMIVLLIIVTGVTWMYNIYTNSIKFASSQELKLDAISIAKEGLEWFNNIRDTNWLLYLWNKENCWNTLNYSSDCILKTWNYYIKNNQNYKIYTWTNNRWFLSEVNSIDFTNTTDRNNIKIWLDSNNFYTQSWSIKDNNHLFTRILHTQYIDTNSDTITDHSYQKILVTSTVKWKDNSSSEEHEVKLSKIFSNWK